MRIQKTDSRERKWQNLKEATGESTVSGALDTAADYYIRMRGGTPAVPKGQVAQLLELAREEGSVTPEQIADVLDNEDLPIQVTVSTKIGHD